MAAGDLPRALTAFLATRLRPGDRLCVALSGGRDSVTLLHALCLAYPIENRPFALTALHVHHGLSPHAEAWASFCADFCAAHAVPLSVVRVAVPRASGEGIEAAARRVRHAAFAACAADWLALAHHRDDQAETVLLNLLRGAGVAGAAGMLAERAPLAGPTLLRPLLDVAPGAIAAHAAAHALPWVDDESNADVHFRRNFLRHDILPRIEARFPGAALALARAAGHFAEGSDLLDALARLDHEACVCQSGRIALPRFNALPPPRARNLLRFALQACGFRAPQTRWLDEALRQLRVADAVSETCVSTADGALHVYRGELHLQLQRAAVPAAPLSWQGEDALPWAGGQVRFVAAQGEGASRRLLAENPVRLTARQGGERLRPDPRRPRRTLRNLLQERAVPPWERERLPYLYCGDQLLWVGGIGLDAAFACAPHEAGVRLLWVPEG